jgi:hypothetical protein
MICHYLSLAWWYIKLCFLYLKTTWIVYQLSGRFMSIKDYKHIWWETPRLNKEITYRRFIKYLTDIGVFRVENIERIKRYFKE